MQIGFKGTRMQVDSREQVSTMVQPGTRAQVDARVRMGTRSQVGARTQVSMSGHNNMIRYSVSGWKGTSR